jgi:3-hydroxybutyryl-CoA dehydrogenase
MMCEQRLAVLGAGLMGTGIGQCAAIAGLNVAMFDVDADAFTRSRSQLADSLARLVRSGKVDADASAAVTGRVSYSSDLDRVTADADVVVEAVPEILSLKQQIIRDAAAVAPATAIFCSNTSQLSITAIAAECGPAADRVIGTHFYNPPVIMRLVEVVRGFQTSDATLGRAIGFTRMLGKEIVVCQKDAPGFITTRAYLAMRLECMRILEEGIATAEDIDRAMCLGYNLPMGPLELGDFNGLDVTYHALRSLTEAYGDRFLPTPTLINMINSGRLGRKTGQGFYSYNAED